VAVIDHLVFYLRQVVRFWRTWNGYFAVLAHFTSLGKAEAGYGQKHELVGKLIDIYLKERSPHPELNNLPTDRGRRLPLRSQSSVPDFLFFLRLLRHLICAQGLDQLSQVSREMALNQEFVVSLFTEASTYPKAQEVVPVIQFLARDPGICTSIAKLLGEEVQRLSHEQIRPHLRIFLGLLEIKDHIHGQRVSQIVDYFLKIMEAQRGYYKETDMCADHLIRWAKKVEAVRQWLASNGGRLEWLIQWLKENPKPSPENKDMKVEKDRADNPGLHQDKWETLVQTTKYYFYGLDPAVKVTILEALKNGQLESLDQDTREAGYDSDEGLHTRRFTQGQEVDCVDTDLKWLRAKVMDVDNNGRALIAYEGWGDKWNEWVPWNSPRIAERGRFSPYNPPPKKKKQQQQQ
jgi:hypothetical protein